jgi:phospho-N-acetylmuramoyl-pentapeptide-transferase
VIAMLMAAATAFLVTILATPVLIARLKRQGIGQQIRDDGPIAHPHVAKAGTPTMGGIAIVGAAVLGYVVAHFRHTSACAPGETSDCASAARRSGSSWSR